MATQQPVKRTIPNKTAAPARKVIAPKQAAKPAPKPQPGNGADDGASPFSFQLKAGELPPPPPVDTYEGDVEVLEVRVKPASTNPDLFVHTIVFGADGGRKFYHRINLMADWVDPNFNYSRLADNELTQYRINVHGRAGLNAILQATGVDLENGLVDLVGSNVHITTKNRSDDPSQLEVNKIVAVG